MASLPKEVGDFIDDLVRRAVALEAKVGILEAKVGESTSASTTQPTASSLDLDFNLPLSPSLHDTSAGLEARPSALSHVASSIVFPVDQVMLRPMVPAGPWSADVWKYYLLDNVPSSNFTVKPLVTVQAHEENEPCLCSECDVKPPKQLKATSSWRIGVRFKHRCLCKRELVLCITDKATEISTLTQTIIVERVYNSKHGCRWRKKRKATDEPQRVTVDDDDEPEDRQDFPRAPVWALIWTSMTTSTSSYHKSNNYQTLVMARSMNHVSR